MRRLIVALLTVVVLAPLVVWAQDAARWNEQGIQAYNAGKHSRAIELFEKSLDQVPQNETVRRNLCNALQSEANNLAKTNDFDVAMGFLERAIQLDPTNVSPLVQLGSYYLRTDHVGDAIRRLEEAIELKPGHVDAHELLGEAYYRDNDLSAARAQWDYVLRIAPERPGLRERYEKAFREESVEFDFNHHSSRNFQVSYPQGVTYAYRARVVSILETAYWTIGKKFGEVYPPPPVQVILYDADQFSEATLLSSHVGAVFDGKIRAPIKDQEGNYLPDDELKRRLTHEYVHVVIRHIAGAKVPWWLNEGLAETFSKEMDATDYNLLSKAFSSEGAFSLRQLEGSQLNNLSPEILRLAYSQSHATARFLWTRYGRAKLSGFMNDIAGGMTVEEALRSHFQRDYTALEREVERNYR